jgi:hypothetical protein
MRTEGQKHVSTFAEKVPAKKGSVSVVLPVVENEYYYIRAGDPNKNVWAYSGNFNIIKPGESPKPPVSGSSIPKKNSASSMTPTLSFLTVAGAAACLALN